MNDLDQLCIQTLRFLAVDAVQQADSGHPGMPLGAAPMAYVLWDRFLRHNPGNPHWFNRDRFVLSAGHGSMLLYALLHMTGYDLPLTEIENFRQWESMTPGHPEADCAPGVEVTTGPLGQGLAMSVGIAMAERFLAAQFNMAAKQDRPEFNMVDHHTYAICSDGDLMEGIASEAASLAGFLQLGKLVSLYDDNDISIEGHTDLTFTENVAARFEAYGWQVLHVEDGNELAAIESAISQAQTEENRPSLIIVRTHIGYGSPLQDTAEVHGAPLGEQGVTQTKQALGWPQQPKFHIPTEARTHMNRAMQRGAELEEKWETLLADYCSQYPELGESFHQAMENKLPPDWDIDIPVFDADDGPIATRTASGDVLNAITGRLPTLFGGSADLAPSTKTTLEGYGDFGPNNEGARNIHFGVREHAMGAIVNGMARHGGIIPFGATFLVFSDYMRPALRLSALMKTNAIFIFTHDSIGLGEDGPTHQPVEHLMTLRAIPNMTVIRPADANETAAAWHVAVSRKQPVALVLTRQKLPVLDPLCSADGLPRGAYVLAEADAQQPHIVIIATGSEVHLALAARRRLAAKAIDARVVSMPCWELFGEQPQEYRHDVLPPGVPRLALEAGVTLGWERHVGEHGDIIGLDRFGASAPGDVALTNLGFNVDNVVNRARALLGTMVSDPKED